MFGFHLLFTITLNKGQSQGLKVIDLGVIGKHIISGVCMQNINSLWFKLKTDRQTDRIKTICPQSFDPGALKYVHDQIQNIYMPQTRMS